MIPRIALNVLTTGELGWQNEVTAHAPLPLSGADKRLIDMNIGEVLEDTIRMNQHGIAYYIQSTGDVKVVLIKEDTFNNVSTPINVSEGTLHILHIKPTTEQRLDTHIKYKIRVTNVLGEINKVAIVKS